MKNKTLDCYKNNNVELSAQYNSVDFIKVHEDWLEYLPSKGSLILDVGAGSGRDALWLAQHGHEVKAVEPVTEFIENFKANNAAPLFEWVVDSLPLLSTLNKYANSFDLVLLSAVWMHLTPKQREQSFQTLSCLNKPGGLLIISLRHGASPDQRMMLPVSINEIELLANKYQYKVLDNKQSSDQLNRTDVVWETVILKRNNTYNAI
ncbi:MAG: class I SAM-dependent methyltransferase [Gammaproteobacteria bacterium]|nr:class I SAM-dependent methyltransferase [Gammaproteobacteria bacterium]